ncbi:MAG: hypothetical protein H0T42_31870 [Deltaproteobacteria bacterium]|nr:hypothetical protein [Deltaproteobacteria bacterium]
MKRDTAKTIFRTVVFAGAMLGTGACGKKQAATTPGNTSPVAADPAATDPAAAGTEAATPDPCAGVEPDPCAGERPRPNGDGGGGMGRGFVLS